MAETQRLDESDLKRESAAPIGAALKRMSAIGWLLWRRGNKEVVRRCLRLVRRPEDLGLRLETLGTDYGGWTVPVDLIGEDWVCYCVGVGCDVSFDVALRERFGCEVHCFDPTPRAINYMQDIDSESKGLRFHEWGLWTEDTTLRFFAPADKRKTSHSVLDLNGTGEYFDAECLSLESMQSRLGHERVDLLKMDIEGAWRPVVDRFVADGISVPVLCIEFDSPTSMTKVLGTISRLRRIGYRLADYHKENFLFVHESAVPGAAA